MTEPITGPDQEPLGLTLAQWQTVTPALRDLVLAWDPHISNGFRQSRMRHVYDALPGTTSTLADATMRMLCREWVRDNCLSATQADTPITTPAEMLAAVPDPRPNYAPQSTQPGTTSQTEDARKVRREAARTGLIAAVNEKLHEAGCLAAMTAGQVRALPIDAYVERTFESFARSDAASVSPNANLNAYRAAVRNYVRQELRGMIDVSESQDSLATMLEGVLGL